jgi:peroxiredoxin
MTKHAMRVIPGDTMPAIRALLAGGGRWALAREKPAKLALLALYRGAFCPVCRTWLADLDRLVPEFEKRGVSVIALSCDRRDGAEKALKEWRLKNLRVGYKLDVEDARRAGLFISEGRGLNPGTGLKEPRLFAEPALLLVKPEGDLYAAWIQSTPYARVHLAEVLTAVDNFVAKNLPEPRGSA